MISRAIFLVLGVSLLVGCGRNDRPTVRRTTIPREETPAARPVQATDAADVEPVSGSTTLPDRDPGLPPQAAEEAHPSVPEVAGSGAKEAEPSSENASTSAKSSDAPPPPKVAATAPAGPDAAASAPSRKDAPVTKADATAPASPSRPVSSLYVDGGPPKMVTATPPKPVTQEKPDADPREVRFGGLSLVAPQGWSRQPLPLQSIGVAEFSLRRSQGDSEDAQLTVTVFVKEDPKGLARLRDQLKEEERAPDSTVQHLTLGGHEVIIVDSTEEADEDADSRPSSASKRRYRALNAMVFLGNTVYSVQCTGPEKTVTERLGEFRAFLETMKAVE